MATTAATSPAPRLKHPPGLYALFAAEMWERFSYYGMRALLVLYLTQAIGMNRPDALAIYAVYTGLVYLTPLIGGRLADRYLGQRKAVFIGGILMALGQFAMTQPALLSLGLGLLIVGNGFFKPNISTMVGNLYPAGDIRRDGAYTIFYMGINLGAFLAPLVCGPLGENLGWWPGFAAAGIGMALGLICFSITQRLLQGVGLPPGRPAEPGAVLQARDYVHIVLIAGALALGVYGAIQAWPAYLEPLWSPAFLAKAGPFVSIFYKGAVLIGLLGLFLYLTEPRSPAAQAAHLHEPLTGEDWQRICVILIISLFSVVFWAGFEQSGGTLNLFARDQTNRQIGGLTVPASVLQAANPLFIILLAPLFAELWTVLAARNFPLPSFAKQGLGLVLLGVAFGVMYLADELERPTPEFPAKLEAAARSIDADAGTVKLVRRDPNAKDVPTVGETIAGAQKQLEKGKIPYKELDDSLQALRAAGSSGGIEALQAASDEAAKSRVSMLWLLAVYFIFTVAELCISPIGLSLVNKLAPVKLASLMMACWFLCTAVANYLAGIMEHDIVEPLHLNLWGFLGLIAAVPGVLMLLVTPLLIKMSHGKA